MRVSFMLARFNLSFKGDGQVWHREREGKPGQSAATVKPKPDQQGVFVRNRGGWVETGVPVYIQELCEGLEKCLNPIPYDSETSKG